ncbi:sialate O-acetylesterase [Segetibacter sp. 3557_3]|uniref:sialate O-acetylesterase n=1 Tax=Segetibacter sp. 3557_3 TaxID=2547429 RepID=UPI0010585130|nr:sialate O-acetylesterase [Segetibacter sp. 3557_3]TDH26991.1 sialate O-acetylesterase [Segetibacter sp. 3557_3]
MKAFLFIISMLLLFTSRISAQVRLPQLVRDSMILQRDQKVNVWGWAKSGEKITVSFAGKKYRTTARDGQWRIALAPLKAGGPYTMNIDASNHITLKEILIGDVWFCSGQSNMVHQMELHSVLYATDVASANYPQIRQFWVPNITSLQGPEDDLPFGFWKSANPNDVRQFSAVAYFFARKLYDTYKVPIGLINASWGGTPIESWLSEDGFKTFPANLTTIQKNKDTAYINGLSRRASAFVSPPRPDDKGLTGSTKWFDPTYVPKGWRTISVPGYWEDQGVKDLDGTVWYRKEVDVSGSMAAAAAKVFLGRIVDADALYVNGKQVGNTTYMYPQRRYALPAGTLKAGKNLFVVRVTNNGGKGGFVPDKPYQLIAGNDTIELTGYWQYKVGQVFTPQRGFGGGGIALHNQPTALFNAMVAPFVNYSVKGFLWYQGETNAGRPDEYAKLQPALIDDWRSKWNQPNAPFLYVQLPGYMDMSYQPVESQWAAFREAQAKSLSVPNTAMAVAIDLGEWNDIHPDRKKEAGERLALAAQKTVYLEKDQAYLSPMYKSARVEGNHIVVAFDNVGAGLTTNDSEEPGEFAIAGADKKFVWANAKIEGDQVVVSSEKVTAPMYVRYGWADNPVNPNVYNKEGLPLAPFRTDSPNAK